MADEMNNAFKIKCYTYYLLKSKVIVSLPNDFAYHLELFHIQLTYSCHLEVWLVFGFVCVFYCISVWFVSAGDFFFRWDFEPIVWSTHPFASVIFRQANTSPFNFVCFAAQCCALLRETCKTTQPAIRFSVHAVFRNPPTTNCTFELRNELES